MLSESQFEEQKTQTKILVDKLLEEGKNYTISDLAKLLNMPTSTVQRRLDNEQMIDTIFGVGTYSKVKKILDANKKLGNALGGYNFACNNESLKDENGHFIGSRKRM